LQITLPFFFLAFFLRAPAALLFALATPGPHWPLLAACLEAGDSAGDGGGGTPPAKLWQEVISPLSRQENNARAAGSESMVRVTHLQICLCVVHL